LKKVIGMDDLNNMRKMERKMNERVLGAIIILVALALAALILYAPPEKEQQPPVVEITHEASKLIAKDFVNSAPTYALDGFELEHTDTASIPNCEKCWEFTFSFKSGHAGYGNRTGQMLAQVITPHTASVDVKSGVVVSAFLDQKWDMKEQRMLDGGGKPVAFTQLIEFHGMQGIRNWVHELDQRDLSALINVQESILKENADEFKVLADRGYEIAGGYHMEPFWDVNYSFQHEKMSEAKELVENITEKPMRVFGSRYFAYDETTLQVADELGVDFILARGTDDVEAVIYEPEEYDAKIISVSNVEFETMGRGSLCDYSLWARGALAEDFTEKLQYALNKSPERLMVVSHAYLGGLKESWWQAYRDFLDSDEVHWAEDFDSWVSPENGINREMPFEDIPINREVQYVEPKPAEPLENLTNVSNMYNPCAPPGQSGGGNDTVQIPEGTLMILHNNQGPMCMDALEWLDSIRADYLNLSVEEYLTTEQGGADMLADIETHFGSSEGISDDFGYLPVIVYESHAYSGFDESIGDEIKGMINS
jgi:peptidoglycan/xylan/chitin deacetylase (PgdA/CDA1 family)